MKKGEPILPYVVGKYYPTGDKEKDKEIRDQLSLAIADMKSRTGQIVIPNNMEVSCIGVNDDMVDFFTELLSVNPYYDDHSGGCVCIFCNADHGKEHEEYCLINKAKHMLKMIGNHFEIPYRIPKRSNSE